jgi:hypothetical protein
MHQRGQVLQRQKQKPEDDWIINPHWFRHLAPAELVPYHQTFDYLYREWLGRELAWQRETGRSFQTQPLQIVNAILRGEKLRVPIGDPIPTIEMMVEVHPDGSRIAKVLPRWLQRTVTEVEIRRRSRAPDGGNTSLPGFTESHPTMLMEVSRFDPQSGAFIGVRNLLIVPAYLLVKVRPNHIFPSNKPYTVYCHNFGNADDEEASNYYYYGITQRSWQERWNEHARDIASGSQLKFHRVFRDEVARGNVNFIGHDVVHVADSVDELYDWEEDLVGAAWGDPKLLNMIPGGKAGIAYMVRHGMLGRNSPVRPDFRDKALVDWARQHSRVGLPAPWVSERWGDTAWASSFVCSGIGRLTEQQVRHIRVLGQQGIPIDEIRERAGARTLAQVRGVLSGNTYNRVS